MKRKIFVKAKTGAKQEKIEKTSDMHFNVSVKERPIEGKANSAIIKALAKYFKVPKSCIIILKGASSKNKVFEIIK